MLPIIICEDQEVQRTRIRDFIEQVILRENYDFEIILSTGSAK